MPRPSYRERNYAFGQAMLRLRTSIGLTQAGLAAHLGVSRRAIGEWEAGSTYPKEEHLQHFLELCVQQHVFAPEQERITPREIVPAGRILPPFLCPSTDPTIVPVAFGCFVSISKG